MGPSNKFDFKTVTIIVLGIALVLVILYGNIFNQPNTDNYAKEISRLHSENKSLILKNDSINVLNKRLDSEIAEINVQIEEKKKKLASTQLELDILKKRNNEIIVNVNNLSADGVADSFAKYLQSTDKGKKNN